MLKPVKVTWGADPEGFFANPKGIVGSEKLLPKNGYSTPFGRITRDGVQFELHPNPGVIKEVSKNVGGLLIAADRLAKDDGLHLEYKTLVEVSKEELDSLSLESRVLGCTPSHNVYGEKPISADPATYPKRSAAGHVHIGMKSNHMLNVREKLVPLMDIFVGNTCVLLDRDPDAAERRENYGRAGECRFPKHGVEYRTTSNFWLRDPSLMHFTFGMAGIATAILAEYATRERKLWDHVVALANIDKVRQAIDSNDFGLALRNFNQIAPVIRDNVQEGVFPLDGKNIGTFVNMAVTVNRHGLDHFFPKQNMITRWRKQQNTDLLAQ